jgi:hypothetical protein
LIAQAKKRPGLGKPTTPLRKVMTTLKAKTAATSAQPSRPRLF